MNNRELRSRVPSGAGGRRPAALISTPLQRGVKGRQPQRPGHSPRRCALDPAFALALLVWLLGMLYVPAAPLCAIQWSTMDAGGCSSASALCSLTGTIGQPDAGRASSANCVLEGGFWGGASDSGVPPLTIEVTATNVIISWPATAGNWILQQSISGASGPWTEVTTPPTLVGGRMQVILPLSAAGYAFRLVSAPTGLILTIARTTTNTMVVSWPGPAPGWVLQETAKLVPASWADVSTPAVEASGRMQVVLAAAATGRFYRLAQSSALPALSVARTATNTVVVSWPSPSSGWSLQQNTDPRSTNWTAVPGDPADNGTTRSVTVTPAPGNRFYRLTKP